MKMNENLQIETELFLNCELSRVWSEEFETFEFEISELEERMFEAATPAIMIVLIGLIPIFFLSKIIRESRPGKTWVKK